MSTKLYVGNLSFNSTEASLLQAFGEDSRQVVRVSIITDRETGRPRGFAFVEMATEADTRSAIASMDGAELDGRKLRVNTAQDRKPARGDRNA
ncbi:MAG: RNA-binding protein [Planctomycetota bacterium]